MLTLELTLMPSCSLTHKTIVYCNHSMHVCMCCDHSMILDAFATRRDTDRAHCTAGHSMGGALATLAAYDLRQELVGCGRGEVGLLCYSFGAPHTGNHAFARDYNHMVPDTWSIINDQARTWFQAK